MRNDLTRERIESYLETYDMASDMYLADTSQGIRSRDNARPFALKVLELENDRKLHQDKMKAMNRISETLKKRG